MWRHIAAAETVGDMSRGRNRKWHEARWSTGQLVTGAAQREPTEMTRCFDAAGWLAGVVGSPCVQVHVRIHSRGPCDEFCREIRETSLELVEATDLRIHRKL